MNFSEELVRTFIFYQWDAFYSYRNQEHCKVEAMYFLAFPNFVFRDEIRFAVREDRTWFMDKGYFNFYLVLVFCVRWPVKSGLQSTTN